MANQIAGKIYKILPVQTGSGKNGDWIKCEFVVETEEQYPKKVCIAAWGNTATGMDSYSVGEKVTVHVNIESREYNERWYTEVKAWKMERTGKSESQESTKEENYNQDNHSNEFVSNASKQTFTNDDEIDLPF